MTSNAARELRDVEMYEENDELRALKEQRDIREITERIAALSLQETGLSAQETVQALASKRLNRPMKQAPSPRRKRPLAHKKIETTASARTSTKRVIKEGLRREARVNHRAARGEDGMAKPQLFTSQGKGNIARAARMHKEKNGRDAA